MKRSLNLNQPLLSPYDVQLQEPDPSGKTEKVTDDSGKVHTVPVLRGTTYGSALFTILNNRLEADDYGKIQRVFDLMGRIKSALADDAPFVVTLEDVEVLKERILFTKQSPWIEGALVAFIEGLDSGKKAKPPKGEKPPGEKGSE